jgi:N-acetyltransferase
MKSSATCEPLVLQGEIVRLEPLAMEHEEALNLAAADGELWTLPYTIVPARDKMHDYLERALEAQAGGYEQPFAIVNFANGRVVGTTRYLHIDLVNRRREIGYTWLASSAQRTGINTEAKYLLLKHAFENSNCIRVEFVTDVLNKRSRAALSRIGATEEGILRNHMIMPSGRYRDSVCFSIIEAEWPRVKDNLVHLLQAGVARSVTKSS